MDKQSLKQRIDVAAGRAPADLRIANCRVVDVYNKAVFPADVLISGGYIAGWGAPDFPEAREVPREQRLALGQEIIRIAAGHGMTVKPCAEGDALAAFGADCGGCMRIGDYEKAIGKRLAAPKRKGARAECACYLACDIGAYNTCRHLCRYCYANAEPAVVLAQSRLHDPGSPFLIGNYMEGDVVHDVPQRSWIDGQMRLEL